MPLTRAALWLRIGSVVLFLAPLWLLLVPQTRWIPRLQGLIFWKSIHLPYGQYIDERDSEELYPDITVDRSTVPRNEVARMTFPFPRGYSESEIALENYAKAHPNDPLIVAAACNAIAGNLQRSILGLAVESHASTDTEATRSAAERLLVLAKLGERADPQNGYFATLEAGAYEILNEQVLRDAALTRAADSARVQSYCTELNELRVGLIREKAGYLGEFIPFILELYMPSDNSFTVILGLKSKLIIEGPDGLYGRTKLVELLLKWAAGPDGGIWVMTLPVIIDNTMTSYPLQISGNQHDRSLQGKAFGWELSVAGGTQESSAWAAAAQLHEAATKGGEIFEDFPEWGDAVLLSVCTLVALMLCGAFSLLVYGLSHLKIPSIPIEMYPNLFAAIVCIAMAFVYDHAVSLFQWISAAAFLVGLFIVLIPKLRLIGWIIGPIVSLYVALSSMGMVHEYSFLVAAPILVYLIVLVRVIVCRNKPKEKRGLIVPGLLSFLLLFVASVAGRPAGWWTLIVFSIGLCALPLLISSWNQQDFQSSFKQMARCCPALMILSAISYIGCAIWVVVDNEALQRDMEYARTGEIWFNDQFASVQEQAKTILVRFEAAKGPSFSLLPKFAHCFDSPKWIAITEQISKSIPSDSEMKEHPYQQYKVRHRFKFASADSAARFLRWCYFEGLGTSVFDRGRPSINGTVELVSPVRVNQKELIAVAKCLYWIALLSGGEYVGLNIEPISSNSRGPGTF